MHDRHFHERIEFVIRVNEIDEIRHESGDIFRTLRWLVDDFTGHLVFQDRARELAETGIVLLHLRLHGEDRFESDDSARFNLRVAGPQPAEVVLHLFRRDPNRRVNLRGVELIMCRNDVFNL